MRRLFSVVFIALFAALGACPPASGGQPGPGGAHRAVEVSVDGPISTPQFYILRRAMREASTAGADAVLINLNTPGGDMETTLKMMELISDFGGRTLCYVNPDAGSAGSYIAMACDEIWFSPRGVMGAAEVVDGSGADIPEAMKRKLDSFLTAKVRALSSGKNPNRVLIHGGMTNPDSEFDIGPISKKKGSLLSITADEAVAPVDGRPVFADGIASDPADALRKSFGGAEVEVEKIEPSALEGVAKYISGIAPVLMGIGIFLLLLEVKTAGFGVFGILGISALAVVFLGSQAAGLTGYEAVLIFAAGIALLAIELFVLPGFFVFGAAGAGLVLYSLVMAGAAPMPSEGRFPSLDSMMAGFGKVAAAALIAAVLLYFSRSLFKSSPLWRRMVLDGGLGNGGLGKVEGGLVGMRGRAVSDMLPNGKVEVGGKSYDGMSEDSSFIPKGADIEVAGADSFQLKVRKI